MADGGGGVGFRGACGGGDVGWALKKFRKFSEIFSDRPSWFSEHSQNTIKNVFRPNF